MKERPLISIIIVNWNGESFIGECLSSVSKTSYPNLEIIVVDNNSKDKSIEIIESFKGIILFKNKQNSGYTGGNNIGFSMARGDYIVTLNNDMTVDPNWLDEPVRKFQHYSSLGIISCRQMQYYKPEKIDGLFNELKKDLSFVPFGQDKEVGSDKQFSSSGYVLSANGGSSIFRKKMIDEIGMFDEQFFGYYDETDLCLRAFLYGWKCAYLPSSVVYHKGGMSFKRDQSGRYYLRERNRFWFIYKNLPVSTILANMHHFLIMELRILRLFSLKCRKPKLYFKARLDAIIGFKNYRELRKKHLDLFRSRRGEFKKLLRDKIIPFS